MWDAFEHTMIQLSREQDENTMRSVLNEMEHPSGYHLQTSSNTYTLNESMTMEEVNNVVNSVIHDDN